MKIKNISKTRKTAFLINDMWFVECSNCGYTRATTDDEGNDIPNNYCANCGYKLTDKGE